MGSFCHVSMLIELDQEWWWPAPEALTDTANYFPRRSRTYLHESIHFWQQLSHGYLFALAEEDWHQLRRWEQGGAAELGPLRARFQQPAGQHGFSPSDICESLARFWEVVAVGPRTILAEAIATERKRRIDGVVPNDWLEAARDAETWAGLEIAIELGGTYSTPYLVAQHQLGKTTSQVLFPLLAHFSLKTHEPVELFERFLIQVAPLAGEHLSASGAEGSLWQRPETVASLFDFVRRACADVAREAGQQGLVDAATLFRNSPLQDNAVYASCFDSLANVDRDGDIDIAIAMPAGPGFRQRLARELPPPCVRFRDRHLPIRQLLLPDGAPEQAAAKTLAESCLELQERWVSFQDALRR
ncbi:MAG: hypothetical protein V5B40_17575 [Candidatus Accumulibacter meliphilus]|jgi:hypothetical protein|uniref:hypothetical protein n=1 Tax=Candidatus Accumulibacter meliphilus TaxID=2211374 RepID=UPI002FC29DCB